MEIIPKKSFYDNWGSSISFIANLLNFVLATAVFTIPFPMHEVGIILGTIILTIICFVSVIACTFIVEALALKNSLIKQENSILEDAIQDIEPIERKTLEKENEEKNDEEKDSQEKNNDNIDYIIITDEGEQKILDNLLDEQSSERRNTFYIAKRYEISKLSKALPKVGYFFVVFTIIFYLYVGITSNAIIAGNNLKDIIGKSLNVEMPDYSYYIIVSIIFLITIIIALNNIKHLKKFSMVIMVMRFLIIFLIIGSCVYSIVKYGISEIKDIPKFDISNITVKFHSSKKTY